MKLNADFIVALQTPDIKDKLHTAGIEIVTSTPELFAAYFKREVARWGKVVKEAGVKGE